VLINITKESLIMFKGLANRLMSLCRSNNHSKEHEILFGFDADFYQSYYSDLIGVDPQKHFLQYGAYEGRIASPTAQSSITTHSRGQQNIALSFCLESCDSYYLATLIRHMHWFGVDVNVFTKHHGAYWGLITNSSYSVRLISQPLSDIKNTVIAASVPVKDHDQACTKQQAWSLLLDYYPHLKRVSVVVPNYNYAHVIEERLASIIQQSYPIYELILLDDASTDDSVRVMEGFLNDLNRPESVTVNTHNGGNVFAQWYKGANVASGDYLWIAEADDSAQPDFLSELCEPTGDFTLAIADSASIDMAGKPINDSYRFRLRPKMISYLDSPGDYRGPDFVQDVLGVENQILNASGVLFNRQALAAFLAKRYKKLLDYVVAGDWYCYVALLLANDSKIRVSAKALNIHRLHSSSVTNSSNQAKQLREIAAIQRIVWAFVRDSDLREGQQQYLEDVAEWFKSQNKKS